MPPKAQTNPHRQPPPKIETSRPTMIRRVPSLPVATTRKTPTKHRLPKHRLRKTNPNRLRRPATPILTLRRKRNRRPPPRRTRSLTRTRPHPPPAAVRLSRAVAFCTTSARTSSRPKALLTPKGQLNRSRPAAPLVQWRQPERRPRRRPVVAFERTRLSRNASRRTCIVASSVRRASRVATIWC